MSAPAESRRYTIAVDFDGVIHRYDSPWVAADVIPDPPVEGAIEWLWNMVQHFDVCITSTRNHQPGGIPAMRRWLRVHGGNLWNESMGARGLEDVQFPLEKPAALIYLDDRAVRFIGRFPTRNEIHEARPWNKVESRIASEGPALVEGLVTAAGVRVLVKKLPDDPAGVLRASLGGDPVAGYYVTYRGDITAVRHLIETALQAVTQ